MADRDIDVYSILESLSAADAAAWLESNADRLTADQLDVAYDYVASTQATAGPMSPDEAAWNRASIAIDRAADGPPSSQAPTIPEPSAAGSTPSERALAEAEGAPTSQQEFLGANADQMGQDAEAERVGSRLQDRARDEVYRVASRRGALDEGVLRQMLESDIPDWMSPAQAEQVIQAAISAGTSEAMDQIRSEAVTAGMSEEAARAHAGELVGTATGLGSVPSWMLDEAGALRALSYDEATGAMRLDPALADRLLDYYNSFLGESVGSIEELFERIQDSPSAEVKSIWQAAVAGSEPFGSMNVQLMGDMGAARMGGTFALDERHMAFLKGNYGLTNDSITALVRQVAMASNDSAELNANLGPIAGLVNAQSARWRGVGGTTTEQRMADQAQAQRRVEQLQRDIARTRQEMDVETISVSVGQSRLRRFEQELREQQRLAHGPEGMGRAVNAAGQVVGGLAGRAIGSALSAVDRIDPFAARGTLGVTNAYRKQLARFHNIPSLGMLGVMDEGLANRIYMAGGDMEKVSSQDMNRANELLAQSGIDGVMGRDGLMNPDFIYNQIRGWQAFQNAHGGGRGGGGGGRVRRLLDQEAVKSQINQLWQSFFRQDAPEGLAASFGRELQRQLDSSPDGQDFDATARIQNWIRGQGVYDEMYGSKPAGMNDDEWQMMFASGQVDMLGSDIMTDSGTDHVAQGMRDGDYQTTVGSAFFGGLGRGSGATGNSRLLERLARAANVVAQNT